MRWGIVFTWWGKIFLYPGYHGYHGSPDRISVVFPCMLSQHIRRIRERDRGVTSRSWPGSRPWYLSNIWSDPGQIRGTVTSWWKAWSSLTNLGLFKSYWVSLVYIQSSSQVIHFLFCTFGRRKLFYNSSEFWPTKLLRNLSMFSTAYLLDICNIQDIQCPDCRDVMLMYCY